MARPPLRRQDAAIPTMPGQVLPAVLPVAPAPAVPDGSGITRGLAARLDALRAGLDRTADAAAAEAAWAAGTVAGEAAPGTQMEGGGVLHRSTYNRAAADRAQRRLDITSRQELDRLAEQHRADPLAFNAAAVAWRDGAARGLPPQMGAQFIQRFDAAALPHAREMAERQRRRVVDDAAATFVAALPGRLAAIDRAGRQAGQDPQAAAALRLEEDQALAELVALGPREGFRIGATQYPPDPSRAGAFSAVEVAERANQLAQRRNDALAEGQWRAAGGGLEWIARFERQAGAPGVAPAVQRAAAEGRAHASLDRLVARLPEAWRPILREAAEAQGLPPELLGALLGLESGGNAQAVSRAGAVGPAQIMPATARDPGFGLPPLPEDALTDPARAIPWAARYLAALRDHFDGDLGLALAAYNWGPGHVRAFARGDLAMPRETRDYLATLLPGVPAGAGLPREEVGRIVSRLRGLHAGDEQLRAEGRAAARAELGQVTAENLAAIAETGEPTRPLDPGLVLRAGEDPARLAARERAAREAFAAGRIARDTTDPAALAALAAEFAPGTENFRADPAAATRLLGMLRQRGVQVAGAGLAERVRDLEAEAEATGAAGSVTEEEARAAGITPERREEINRGVALRAELARLREAAMRLPEEERAARLAEIEVAGAGAAANAERLRALAGAFEARERGLREDPALYALSGLPRAARELAGRAAAGEPEALAALAGLLLAEQERLGVPPAQRRALPRTIADALLGRVLDAAGPDEALGALSALTGAVGVLEAGRLVGEARPGGAAQDGRRRAVAVAAALLEDEPMLARRILAGQLVLRDNPVPGAGANETAIQAQTVLGEAFEMMPRAMADAQAAALALYAARGDLRPGVFDARAFRRELEALAPTTRWGGRATALPRGMDERRFHDLMAALPAERLAGAVAGDGMAITPEMLARGGFQAMAVGPGRYLLRFGGFEVQDARREGAAFVLDINGAEPARAGLGSPILAAPGAAGERGRQARARDMGRGGMVLAPVDQPPGGAP